MWGAERRLANLRAGRTPKGDTFAGGPLPIDVTDSGAGPEDWFRPEWAELLASQGGGAAVASARRRGRGTARRTAAAARPKRRVVAKLTMARPAPDARQPEWLEAAAAEAASRAAQPQPRQGATTEAQSRLQALAQRIRERERAAGAAGTASTTTRPVQARLRGEEAGGIAGAVQEAAPGGAARPATAGSRGGFGEQRAAALGGVTATGAAPRVAGQPRWLSAWHARKELRDDQRNRAAADAARWNQLQAGLSRIVAAGPAHLRAWSGGAEQQQPPPGAEG